MSLEYINESWYPSGEANSTLEIVVASVTYIPLYSYGEKAMMSEGMTSFKETGLTVYE